MNAILHQPSSGTFEWLIGQLHYALDHTERNDPAALDVCEGVLHSFQPDSSSPNRYLNFSDVRYQRNPVYMSVQFELLVLCWQPGQVSPVHNHRYSWCGVKVIQGTASELKFEQTPLGSWVPVSTTQNSTGEVVCSFDADTHILGNFGTENLITLHCYAPPLKDNDIVPVDKTLAQSLVQVYATQPKHVQMRAT